MTFEVGVRMSCRDEHALQGQPLYCRLAQGLLGHTDWHRTHVDGDQGRFLPTRLEEDDFAMYRLESSFGWIALAGSPPPQLRRALLLHRVDAHARDSRQEWAPGFDRLLVALRNANQVFMRGRRQSSLA